MRKIKAIAVHCTATAQNATIASIQNYWKNSLKWKSPGYHYIIEANGKITQLLSIEKVSNGVAGHNSNIINVCYVGGITDKGKGTDNRTIEQKASLVDVLTVLKKQFPDAEIKGHRGFSPDKNGNGIIEPAEYIKQCPCFNAKKEYQHIK